MVGRRCSLLVLAFTALGLAPRAAAAHPLHTTLTELTEDRSRGVARAVVRVFAEDFASASSRAARGAAADVAAMAYLRSTLAFEDRTGRSLPLTSCGTRRTGDLLWVCVEVAAPGGLSSLRIRNAVLTDLFADQVNVVQGTVNGARRSLLFTRGDRSKSVQ